MKTKLTLVTLMCRNKIVSSFIELPFINNKSIINSKTIDKLFLKYWGFTPQRGETINII